MSETTQVDDRVTERPEPEWGEEGFDRTRDYDVQEGELPDDAMVFPEQPESPSPTEQDKMEPDKAVQTSLDVGLQGRPFGIDDGAVTYGNHIVGEFDGVTLTLNAGWCRLAGLGVKIDGDSTDRRRVVFNRPVDDHRLTSRA